MKIVVFFASVLIIAFGCSDNSVNPKLKATVASDRVSDSVDWNIVITQRNESSSNVYLRQRNDCIGFWKLEQKVGGAWVIADRALTSYSSVYPDGQTILRPGEVLRDSFSLAQAGTYRLWFPFSWDTNGVEAEPLSPEEFVAK